MKLQIRIPSGIFENGMTWVRRHINVILFLFFLCAMALAGFVFWRYGYRVTLQEPKVTVRAVAPKESELRALIEKTEEKERSIDTIFEQVFSDPFIQPEKQP